MLAGTGKLHKWLPARKAVWYNCDHHDAMNNHSQELESRSTASAEARTLGTVVLEAVVGEFSPPSASPMGMHWDFHEKCRESFEARAERTRHLLMCCSGFRHIAGHCRACIHRLGDYAHAVTLRCCAIAGFIGLSCFTHSMKGRRRLHFGSCRLFSLTSFPCAGRVPAEHLCARCGDGAAGCAELPAGHSWRSRVAQPALPRLGVGLPPHAAARRRRKRPRVL